MNREPTLDRALSKHIHRSAGGTSCCSSCESAVTLVLCCTGLGCVTLCCAVLCCAMLCCPMLCCCRLLDVSCLSIAHVQVAQKLLDQAGLSGLQGPTISPIYTSKEDGTVGKCGYFDCSICIPKKQLYSAVKAFRQVSHQTSCWLDLCCAVLCHAVMSCTVHSATYCYLLHMRLRQTAASECCMMR